MQVTEVRKHKRQTASGKTTTVRHHTRRGGEGEAGGAQARSAWQDRAAPHYSTLPAAGPPAADESWLDEASEKPEGEWWAEDDAAPGGEPEMSDAFRAMVAQNPDIARGFKELSALRSAGYEGPVDQDGNPTSRRALFRARYKAAGEQEEARQRFMKSRTIPERDAADADYKAAGDKLKALPEPLGKLGE